MIYLSTWGVFPRGVLVDDLASYFKKQKPTSKHRVVRPTFFVEEQEVLVTITDDTAVAPSGERVGLFWMAGSSELTPAQFMAQNLVLQR